MKNMKWKVFFTAFLAAAVFFGILGATGAEAADTIKVSNAREFLEALGSDRIIELEPGDYNLSKAMDAKLPEGVSWSEVFDGKELVLEGITDLTIRTSPPDDVKAEIFVDPRYAFVMKFVSCYDIVLDNIRAGHSEGGDCDGGVFSFEFAARVNINNTSMYGCGTQGLVISESFEIKVTDSEIYDCTYHIMTVTGGEDIAFENCSFHYNKEYTMVNVSGTANMTFEECKFDNNQGQMFNVEGTTISVRNSTFSGNSDSGIRDSANVEFTNCEF